MYKIEEAKYEGYLWWSNSKIPVIYNGTKPLSLQLDDNNNPFIIEGNLWNADKCESIYIRYIDGQHLVRSIIVSEEEWYGIDDKSLLLDKLGERKVTTTRKEFLAHRIPNVSRLRFLQYWETEKDECCEGMYALKPKRLVFVGFNDWKK